MVAPAGALVDGGAFELVGAVGSVGGGVPAGGAAPGGFGFAGAEAGGGGDAAGGDAGGAASGGGELGAGELVGALLGGTCPSVTGGKVGCAAPLNEIVRRAPTSTMRPRA